MRLRHDWVLHLYFNRNEKDLEIGFHLWVLSSLDWDHQVDLGIFTRVCICLGGFPCGYNDLPVTNPSDSECELYQIVFGDQEPAEQVEIFLHCVLFYNRIHECHYSYIIGDTASGYPRKL